MRKISEIYLLNMLSIKSDLILFSIYPNILNDLYNPIHAAV